MSCFKIAFTHSLFYSGPSMNTFRAPRFATASIIFNVCIFCVAFMYFFLLENAVSFEKMGKRWNDGTSRQCCTRVHCWGFSNITSFLFQMWTNVGMTTTGAVSMNASTYQGTTGAPAMMDLCWLTTDTTV